VFLHNYMHSWNYCAELNVWSGCVDVPVLCYRLLIVIDTFPIAIFRSRYPVISNSFSRPAFPIPLPSRLKYTGTAMVGVFTRPLPTVYIPSQSNKWSRRGAVGMAPSRWSKQKPPPGSISRLWEENENKHQMQAMGKDEDMQY
jgi:hypothetical protein